MLDESLTNAHNAPTPHQGAQHNEAALRNGKRNSARAPKRPDYEAVEQRLWQENADDVSALLAANDNGLRAKIETYARQFGYSVDAVREKVANDPMFAAHFAKRPSRQGIHEKIAADWLKRLGSVQDFTVLPKSGANALYVTSDGEVNAGASCRPTPPSRLTFAGAPAT